MWGSGGWGNSLQDENEAETKKKWEEGVWDKDTIDKGASGPKSSSLLLAFNVRIFQSLLGSGVWGGGRIGQCYSPWHKNDICQISFWAFGGIEFSQHRNKRCLVAVTGLPTPELWAPPALSPLGTLTRCPAWHLRAATQPSLPVCHFYFISVLIKAVWGQKGEIVTLLQTGCLVHTTPSGPSLTWSASL